jgi:hypothetical protein
LGDFKEEDENKKRRRRRRGKKKEKEKKEIKVKCGNNMVWSELAQNGIERWENKLCTRKQMEFLTQLHFYHEVGYFSGYILSVWLVLLHLHEA